MKMNITVECTPEEARAFLGLPDVSPINELMVETARERIEKNVEMVDPAQLMKNWTAFGGMVADQFLQVMSAAVGAPGDGTDPVDPTSRRAGKE